MCIYMANFTVYVYNNTYISTYHQYCKALSIYNKTILLCCSTSGSECRRFLVAFSVGFVAYFVIYCWNNKKWVCYSFDTFVLIRALLHSMHICLHIYSICSHRVSCTQSTVLSWFCASFCYNYACFFPPFLFLYQFLYIFCVYFDT